jgi:hypothetical protein
MDDDLRYRTELADRFLGYVATISIDQWNEIDERHRADDHFYSLALELASEATQLLGADRMATYQAALEQRFARVDALLHEVADRTGQPVPRRAYALVKAAVHAVLVRDTYGFNSGAFSELFSPFRGIVSVAALEHEVNQSRPSDRAPRTGGFRPDPPTSPPGA